MDSGVTTDLLTSVSPSYRWTGVTRTHVADFRNLRQNADLCTPAYERQPRRLSACLVTLLYMFNSLSVSVYEQYYQL